MQLSNTRTEFRSLGLGALLGAITALAVGAFWMGRKHRIPGYLHQSGEHAGTDASSIHKHDERTFRGDLVGAK